MKKRGRIFTTVALLGLSTALFLTFTIKAYATPTENQREMIEALREGDTKKAEELASEYASELEKEKNDPSNKSDLQLQQEKALYEYYIQQQENEKNSQKDNHQVYQQIQKEKEDDERMGAVIKPITQDPNYSYTEDQAKKEAQKLEDAKKGLEDINKEQQKRGTGYEDKDGNSLGGAPANQQGKGYTEVWNASTDPWLILSGNGGVEAGITSLGGDTFMQRAVRLLRNTLIVLCLIGMMMSLISIPFISNSAQLKDKKDELTHKAIIFAMSFAIFPILNFLKLLMDTQFGF